MTERDDRVLQGGTVGVNEGHSIPPTRLPARKPVPPSPTARVFDTKREKFVTDVIPLEEAEELAEKFAREADDVTRYRVKALLLSAPDTELPSADREPSRRPRTVARNDPELPESAPDQGMWQTCPRCGDVWPELVSMRGRRVCENCAAEGREGDEDYWPWHWHEAE